MWRKEGERLITPIVCETRRAVLVVECKDRKQFDRTDAELFKIWNFVDQSGIGASLEWRNPGARVASEAADMHFVDDGFSE